MNELLEFNYISWPELVLRLALALVFGMILGLDRDRKNKPVDFRAYMIVATTTCSIALMAQELHFLFENNAAEPAVDLGKIVSGVLTGIGFLGAGAIIKLENNRVVGTATGASIWAAGGIGLTLGFGLYGLALISFAFTAIILIIGGLCMEKINGVSDKEQDISRD